MWSLILLQVAYWLLQALYRFVLLLTYQYCFLFLFCFVVWAFMGSYNCVICIYCFVFFCIYLFCMLFGFDIIVYFYVFRVLCVIGCLIGLYLVYISTGLLQIALFVIFVVLLVNIFVQVWIGCYILFMFVTTFYIYVVNGFVCWYWFYIGFLCVCLIYFKGCGIGCNSSSLFWLFVECIFSFICFCMFVQVAYC